MVALLIGAPSFVATSAHGASTSVVGSAADVNGGGWSVYDDGQVVPYGGAPRLGDLSTTNLSKPIVGMASTADGSGYWLVASDGGIFSFGDARFFGSTGGRSLNRPVVGMASTADAAGYWLVASDGGIFSFGDARFFGSTGGRSLNRPVVGMVPTSDASGYWFVGADGGIFSFGNAPFLGSLGGRSTVSVVAMTRSATGYELVDAANVVTSFSATSAMATHSVVGGGAPAKPSGGINFGGAYEEAFNTMTPVEQAAIIKSVASTGLRWMRIDVPFTNVEHEPNNFNFYTDQQMRLAVAAGIHVDALLAYPPGWATAPDGSPDPTAFARFAQVSAAHMATIGVHTYEIINEQNLGLNWGGKVSVAEYAAVLKATYPAIKQADPSSTVVTGGLAPALDATDGSSMSPFTFLTQLYSDGGQGSFDAVGIHPYSYPDMPSQADWWNTFSSLPRIHSLMEANGDANKQVWLTEYGAPTGGSAAVSPAVQAQMISQAYSAIAAWPWAGPLFLFDWQDNSRDGAFGLLSAGGAPKPALDAVIRALGAP